MTILLLLLLLMLLPPPSTTRRNSNSRHRVAAASLLAESAVQNDDGASPSFGTRSTWCAYQHKQSIQYMQYHEMQASGVSHNVHKLLLFCPAWVDQHLGCRGVPKPQPACFNNKKDCSPWSKRCCLTNSISKFGLTTYVLVQCRSQLVVAAHTGNSNNQCRRRFHKNAKQQHVGSVHDRQAAVSQQARQNPRMTAKKSHGFPFGHDGIPDAPIDRSSSKKMKKRRRRKRNATE
jgi:hypothetical protein